MASPVASAALKARVRNPALLKKLARPEDLMHHFPNGSYIGWSGFTAVGYPKKVPAAMADYVEQNNLQSKLKYSLFVGASAGSETENRWAALDMINRRSPHQVGKDIAKGINSGRINFFDKHLSMFPSDLVYGFYTKDRSNSNLDVTVVEATEILEDGSFVPGASVGATPELIQMADKVIIEVNTAIPSFRGLHDITFTDVPPHRTPYNITAVEDRIGSESVKVDPSKVVAIVESDYWDATGPNAAMDDTSRQIAGHLIEFFEHEVAQGRMPANLLPLQSGIGNVANAIVGGLNESKFKNLKVWTEVIQDTFLDLFDSGKLDYATATSTRFSPDGFKRFYDNWDAYADKILLRSQAVSNAPEIIKRLGVIGMNTPVEVDIYAHANSTCVSGTRMLNGLGGSADFLRNAKYSIMHTPSSRPSKTDPHGVSCIVPMCTHIDQTEHDLDVIVTEQGLADVRGLSPRERARVIINKCAHPKYQPILTHYYEKAESEGLKKGMGHEPHLLFNAFDLHKALAEEGSMLKVKPWTDRWALVSSLYGPGTFWSWFCIVASVFISWTINPSTKRSGSITNDLIAALTLPVVAAADALYQLAKYDRPDRPRLLQSHLPEDIQLVAALEAPLAICEVYVVLAMFLHSTASRKYQWKRMALIAVSTIICFSPELVVFFSYPHLSVSMSAFARPFLFNFVLALGFISGIMAIMTGISLIRTAVVALYRKASPPSNGRQHLTTFENRSNLLAGILIALVITTVKSGYAGNTQYFAAQILGIHTRILRFAPQSNVPITDLDQIVALAGGVITLLFSIYDAAKVWRMKSGVHGGTMVN
ncbi:acetyl hydrolase [Fusarium beomiforme]|uniref:Acetyl-CoA hydrolase n=1 Tax=Fusarium beomiforme TaxID=44412 RepID=A0A9P5DXP8_9HYPO|nr:acetyl hydrolase [Fusarium beomiforme]